MFGGGRCDATETTKQIQHDSLDWQQRCQGTRDPADDITGLDGISIIETPPPGELACMTPHQVIQHTGTSQSTTGSSNDGGIDSKCGIDRRTGGEVTLGPQVLEHRQIDELIELGPLDEGGEEL